MEFKITNYHVFGLSEAIKASGNPMRTIIEHGENTTKDLQRAVKLGSVPTGTGHDNFLKGVIVQADFTAPLYWWKQAQRYHWFDFVSSQSTMHCLFEFDVDKQCTSDVDPRVIEITNEKIKEYKEMADKIDADQKEYLWRGIIATLPSGFCLGASMTTNYQQLKTMYLQRKTHKLAEWRIFCDWCEGLPYFLNFIEGKVSYEQND